MKRTLILMTVLNVVMMVAGMGTVLAYDFTPTLSIISLCPNPRPSFSSWPASWASQASRAGRNNRLQKDREKPPSGGFFYFR